MTVPRRFLLYRNHDVSGVSGTGVVAQGVLMPDGTCTLWWPPKPETGIEASLAVHPSLTSLLAIHGHGGATRPVWVDPVDDRQEWVLCGPAGTEVRYETPEVDEPLPGRTMTPREELDRVCPSAYAVKPRCEAPALLAELDIPHHVPAEEYVP